MAYIVWGDGRVVCCSSEESQSPQFPPVVVCRDCGCAFGMKGEQCPPDFSHLEKRGFDLDICQPNDQNVTYFRFLTNKSRPTDCSPGCIPARVPCNCPCCRSKERRGYHFLDCTCHLCLKKRDACLNFYRNDLLAARKKEGFKESEILAQFVVRKLSVEDEDFVPKNRSHLCPCHRYVPKNWFVKDPCPARNDPTVFAKYGQKQSNSGSVKMIQHAILVKPDRLKQILTPSFSQHQQWPLVSDSRIEIANTLADTLKINTTSQKSRSKKSHKKCEG